MVIGNILLISFMLEGMIICNVEFKFGDCGILVKAFGEYCILISYNFDTGFFRIKFSFGVKKMIFFGCCVMVG